MTASAMSVAQAMDLIGQVTEAGVRCWVMGGWGIDALLGEQTRTHHDLDLLVNIDDLPAFHAWLRGSGFKRSYEWEENETVSVGGRMWDTAFVEHHPNDGQELDVHGVHVVGDTVRLCTTDPWALPDGTLLGVGSIGGHDVHCVTAEGQRAMHVGYELPDKHIEDLRRLDAL